MVGMRWEVITHPAVDEWLAALDQDSFAQVTAAVRELRDTGPALGRPLASIPGLRPEAYW
jgi:hypothetical protein